jgi:hypothetical protein
MNFKFEQPLKFVFLFFYKIISEVVHPVKMY